MVFLELVSRATRLFVTETFNLTLVNSAVVKADQYLDMANQVILQRVDHLPQHMMRQYFLYIIHIY